MSDTKITAPNGSQLNEKIRREEEETYLSVAFAESMQRFRLKMSVAMIAC